MKVMFIEYAYYSKDLPDESSPQDMRSPTFSEPILYHTTAGTLKSSKSFERNS